MALIGVYIGFTGIFEHFDRLNRFVIPQYIMSPRVGVQFGRSRGPFAAAVVNGGALIVSFLASTFVWSSLTGKKRLFMFALAMAPIGITVYFTDTRGVWVGFAMVLRLLALTRTKMSVVGRRAVALAALVYFSGVFSKFSVYEETLFSKRSETVDYRFANYATTWEMFKRNPLFGIGYGNFNRMWRNYFVSDDSGEIRDLADGNNTTFLAILGEMGLIGFTSYFLIFVCAGKMCWTAYFRLRGDNWEFERRFVIVASGALLAFLLMGVTTDVRFHEFFNSALFLLFGLVSNIDDSTAKEGITLQSPLKRQPLGRLLRPVAGTPS